LLLQQFAGVVSGLLSKDLLESFRIFNDSLSLG
jgi:hypothetical protein